MRDDSLDHWTQIRIHQTQQGFLNFRIGGPALNERPHDPTDAPGLPFFDDAEKALIRRVVEFPRVIEAAALAHEPHRISFYLYELASDFHSLWSKGKELPQLRFILEGQDTVTFTRLAFLRAIRYCLANGLKVLGVTPVDEM